MAYSWFRAESAAVDHPKVMELAVALKVELALADGYLFRLWSWVQRYAPIGSFSARVMPQLEAYIGRAGVIEVMRASGLIDATVGVDSVEFHVHDWSEMQGDLVEKSKRDAKLKRDKRRVNGARRKRAGAETARLQDRQDQTDITNRTGPTGQEAKAPHPIELLKLWNVMASPELPRAEALTDTREKHAKARLKERALEGWKTVVQRINTSDFCLGQNDRGWRADFDWLLRPDTALKVLEGKYDNRRATGPPNRDATDTPTEYHEGEVAFGR